MSRWNFSCQACIPVKSIIMIGAKSTSMATATAGRISLLRTWLHIKLFSLCGGAPGHSMQPAAPPPPLQPLFLPSPNPAGFGEGSGEGLGHSFPQNEYFICPPDVPLCGMLSQKPPDMGADIRTSFVPQKRNLSHAIGMPPSLVGY
jgi:hypothetical protein